MHPNSLANLEKGEATRFRAGEAQANIARKGAEAANRKRAERKTATECAELIAAMAVNERIQDKLKRAGFKKTDMTYMMALIFAQYGKAIEKGDVNAAKLILSLVGEMPSEESNVNMTVSEGNQVIAYVPDDGREPHGNN